MKEKYLYFCIVIIWNIMKKAFFICLCLLLIGGFCHSAPRVSPFIRVSNGQFIKGGKPYYYIGTNFWYGAILASKGEGGNRKRLLMELDSLKSIGIDNLRILVGADGKNGLKSKVEPTLQKAPGVYNDTILAGLDYLLSEMAKRKMYAVLYLNNSWEWSGGYGQYLEWSGHGQAPIPAIDSWPTYFKYVNQYFKSDSARVLFANHVKYILSRTNRYTKRKYVDDPTIMSWQIGNEPRPFGEENKVNYALWINSVASLIKKLDSNHMVSTGTEGYQGTENDINLWELIHSYSNVDYTTIHIWPYNWGWAKKDSLQQTLPKSIKLTAAYIEQHLAIAHRYGKPLVVEEFGFPRDDFQFAKGSSVMLRNRYYESIFSRILEDALKKGNFAGCNFWSWGGMAKQNSKHIYWERGDDYMGDPAQEEQGLNSVFWGDTTISLIKKCNAKLK